jgi:hypothetical protein
MEGPAVYSGASAQDASVRLTMNQARAAYPKARGAVAEGSLVFEADLRIENKGTDPLPMDSESFDLRDSDGISYMNAPLSGDSWGQDAILGSTTVTVKVRFIVPADAALASLSLVLPADTLRLTLKKR